MMIRASLVMAAAGACAALPALAQEADFICDGIQILNRGTTVHPRGYPPSPYAPRVIGAVYDSYSNCGNNYAFLGAGAGNKRILDDISFVPGPWAPNQPRLISGMVVGAGTTAAGAWDTHIVFWDRDDVNYAGFTGDGTSMINPAATPLGSFVATFEFPANTGDFVQVDMSGLPGGGISIPEDGCYVEAWISAVGGNVQTTGADPGAFIFATNTNQPGNSAAPGMSLIDYGRDFNYDGILTGRPVAENVAGSERRFIVVGTGINLNWAIQLRGNFTVTPPAPTINLNALADGATARTGDTSSIVRFTIGQGALDSTLRYLDIDTEGSATDAALGLFKADGRVVAQDDDSGSGTNAQLTFGIGRRAAVGDGLQYDGRDWDVTSGLDFAGLPAGEYYLLAAPAGSAFGDGFTVIPGTVAAGPVTFNFNTNVNGGANAPAVAPLVTSDLGIIATGTQIPNAPVAPYEVVWWRFESCRSTNATDYFDISAETSTAVDMEMLLFNAAGNLVARDVMDGPGPLSQLSFVAPGNPRPATGDGEPYAGQDGNLPAGVYYLAMTYHRTQTIFEVPAAVAPSPSTNGRFHVRGYGNNAGYEMGGGLFPSWFDCPTVTCVADVDDGSGTGTPDNAVTIDDLLYYLGVFEAGTLEADVDDGSGTGAPDGAVTIDDLLYYLFRFEQGC